MEHLPTVRNAVQAFRNGTYQFPTSYIIRYDIFPHILIPPAESRVTWSIRADHFSEEKRLYRSENRSRRAAPTRARSGDININISSLNFNLNSPRGSSVSIPSVATTPSTPRTATNPTSPLPPSIFATTPGNLFGQPAPQYTRFNGDPSNVRQETRTYGLDKHMRQYFVTHHRVFIQDLRP